MAVGHMDLSALPGGPRTQKGRHRPPGLLRVGLARLRGRLAQRWGPHTPG